MRTLIFVLVTFLSVLGGTVSTARAGDDRLERDSTLNWPMFGRDLQHTFSNSASLITPANVASLSPAWDFPTEDVVSASPAIVNKVLYVGAWDGYFYALQARTGSLIWKFAIDCQNSIVPSPPRCLAPGETSPPRFFTNGGLINSSAAVDERHVFFAGGKTVYSLNASDGSLRWKTVICGKPEASDCAADSQDPSQVFSSPVILGNKLFVGHSTNGTDGYRGGFEALDVRTGEIIWRFEVDPILVNGEPARNSHGQVVGGYNRGCGAVWSSAAVDARYGLIFFGTADCNSQPLPPYHGALLSLDAETGAVKWVFRPERPNNCDYDIGASANLIDFEGKHYVGVGGKDGTYYLLNRRTRNPGGELVWATNVVFGGSDGGFIGSTAFSGARIFGATAIGDGDFDGSGRCASSNPRDVTIQDPSMHALNLVGGGLIWQAQHNHSLAASTIANGVVFSGLVGIEPFGVNAYDAADGTLLATFPAPGSITSAAVPVGEMLFFGSGTSAFGTGGGVHALTLPPR